MVLMILKCSLVTKGKMVNASAVGGDAEQRRLYSLLILYFQQLTPTRAKGLPCPRNNMGIRSVFLKSSEILPNSFKLISFINGVKVNNFIKSSLFIIISLKADEKYHPLLSWFLNCLIQFVLQNQRYLLDWNKIGE